MKQEADTSYQSRNDLAIRSSVGNPTAEPPSAPQSSTSSKSPRPKKAESQGLESAQKGPRTDTSSKENHKSSKSPLAQSAADASLPDFILERNNIFDALKQKRDAEVLEKEKPAINVVLDLGRDKDGLARPLTPVAAKAWESTPGSFLRHVDKHIISDVVIAKVNGVELWDLDRPLEYGCRVSYVPFSSAEGRNVFWHSSAHVLGEACECHYQCRLSHGPPVEQGFFYDMALSEG